jgi:hypothetical protein
VHVVGHDEIADVDLLVREHLLVGVVDLRDLEVLGEMDGLVLGRP